jgi:hypothetical protein
MIIVGLILSIVYFKTRFDKELLVDVPILSSFFAWICLLTAGAAVLAEFVHAGNGDVVKYGIGVGVPLIISGLLMLIYWFYTTGEFLYNKLVNPVI